MPNPNAEKSWLAALGRQVGLLPLLLPLAGGALLIAQAWLLARVLGMAVEDGSGLGPLLPAIAGVAALLLARAGLGIAGEVLAMRASERIKQGLRHAVASALFARPPVWTAARSSGALSSLLVEQVEALDGYLSRYLPAMVQAALLPLAFAAAVMPVDWVAGLLFLVTAPLIPVFMALAGLGAEAAGRRQARALSLLAGRFADRLRGMVTLKLFGRAEAETRAMGAASDAFRTRTLKVMRIAFLSSAVLEFFAALGVAGVALYVGLTFLGSIGINPGLSLAGGLFCLLMAPEVYQPLRLLAAHYHDRANAQAALAEILAHLDRPPSIAPAPAEVPALVARRPVPVRLDRVSVRTPAGRPVIEGASLVLAPGSKTAILGQSGIGKSTLLEALARLRPHEGAIRLGDMDLADLPEAQLRADLAMLGQRPRLFAGSIADNIRLGRRDACDTAVRLAAQRAQVMAFAQDLPHGLATRIGEDGQGLSGGEMQRVALARLYLRDPAILLLDEPTAHLDAATEALVLDGLMDFAAGRTLLMATHSAAAAARVQRVYRIVQGCLLPAPRPGAPQKLRGAAA